MAFQFPPRTFRFQMALVFGLLSVLVGLPTYWYISNQHRTQLIENKRKALEAMAHSAATVLTENLAERHREIELLTQSPLYRRTRFDDAEVRASLERVKQSYTHYSWIGVADAQGRVHAATSGHLMGADVSKRPWFQAGLTRSFVGDIHEAVLLAKLLPNPTPDQPIRFIDFSAPIRDDEGNVKGVLGAHAHWQWAGALLRTVTPEPTDGHQIDVFILNHKGEVIYPENPPAGLKAPSLDALAGGAHNRFMDWGDEGQYLTASAIVQGPVASDALGWRVVVRQFDDTVLAEVRSLQRVNLLTMGAAGLAFLLLAWVVADRVSRPVESLTQTARRIQRGDRNVRFPETFWARELQRLAEALRGMSGTLIAQKEALARSNQDLEAKVAARTAELEELNIELEKQARTDTLTGLPNRLRTNERLAEEFARFQRHKVPYCVLALDVDFFKRVNDTYGHAVGDDVLRHVARVLHATIRQSDFAGRIGGEEFLVVLPATRLDVAMDVAEKIRHAIAQAPVDPVGAITISIGVEEVAEGDADEHVAVTRADDSLYRAKAAGRNRVVSRPAAAKIDV
ncbi:sensor domain-containing diguanylate cyclase [Cupriavidus respiraculi]|nr:GGDEF domain-containing protein [Cupriavidus respiraculi]